MIEMVQKREADPWILVILDGMHENKDFEIMYNEGEVKNCFEMTADEKQNAKKLITVDSDTAGMTIQPWTEVKFDILKDSVLNKTITVVETSTNEVLLCGKLKMKGKVEYWEKAKNKANKAEMDKLLFMAVYCILGKLIGFVL